MKIGEKAPDFSLPDQQGGIFTLSEALGTSGTVLFFYPKDHSSVCTAEACAFRDRFAVFKDAGAIVIGISGDSEDSHRSFANANRLPFPILSDVGGKVRKLYQVPKTLGLIPGRVTYVLDGAGMVVGIFNDALKAETHVIQSLETIAKMGSTSGS